MNNKIKLLMVACSTVLTSCGFSSLPTSSEVTTSSSETSSYSSSASASFTEEILALTFTNEYINENFLLPTLEDEATTVVWNCDTAEIKDGILIYPNPTFDFTAAIDAVLTKNTVEYTYTQPLLVKSQRNAPAVSDMPQLNLTLDGGLQEADIYYEDYIRGTATIDHTVNGNRENTVISSPFGIRIRGNSTRYMPKRAYRLRFDKNTSLLGMASAKNYILLANHIDKSLIRTGIAQFLAYQYPDTIHPLDFRFIELVVNGEYLGQYFMMERVEFQKNRWNVEANFALDDAGFLLELDSLDQINGEGIEDNDYFWLDYRPYYIREPDTEDPLFAPARHTRYISEYFAAANDAIIAKTGYESLIDVDNFVDYFLLQEVTKNVDVNYGSVYMVKETGQPLRMGPLWDFDISMGNGDYFPSQPEGHWGWVDVWEDFDNNNNMFFTRLMEIQTFRTKFVTRLNDFNNRVLPMLDLWLDENHANWIANSVRNLEIWPLAECGGPWCPIPAEQRALETYEQHLDFVKNYIDVRVDWMLENISTTV